MQRPATDLDDVLCDPCDSSHSGRGMRSVEAGSSLGPIRHLTAAGLRRNVWERRGSGLPTLWRKNDQRNSEPGPTFIARTIHIDSHLPVPSAKPSVNYKHLYIVHHILSRRTKPPNSSSDSAPASRDAFHPQPKTVDAISSMEAGGLPGHTEAVYSLDLFHHRMSIKLPTPCSECRESSVGHHQRHTGRLAMTSSPSSAASISGKAWLLSGSRDKTLRLWQIENHKPRVVKIFQGGHQASVLSHFVAILPVRDRRTAQTSSSPSKSKEDHNAEERRNVRKRAVAISGGSDGRICLWDIEEGDGSPEKTIAAHQDSVLCIRGDDEHVVSCSKGQCLLIPLDFPALTDAKTKRSGFSTYTRLIRDWSYETKAPEYPMWTTLFPQMRWASPRSTCKSFDTAHI